MKLNTLDALLLHELRDLYSAERQLLAALPKMTKAATNPKLRTALKEELEITKGHLQRLEEIAGELGQTLGRHKCKGMEGLLAEGADLIREEADDRVRDAGLIGAAQRVEHYEIARYGTARALASRLGHEEVEQLLLETLIEEKSADAILTDIADSAVNDDAASAGDKG